MLEVGWAQDGLGHYSCSCGPGYTGRLCELEVDDCLSSPCHAAATCLDGLSKLPPLPVPLCLTSSLTPRFLPVLVRPGLDRSGLRNQA